jgi:antitoxin MazE
MKTKLVRIGNSRGVRIPKPLLEVAGLTDEVELRIVESRIVLEAPTRPRGQWAEAAADLIARGEDGPLDDFIPTEFDRSEWTWET